MIWLTWRQLRGSAIAMAAVLAVIGAVLLLTGPGMAARHTAGLADCAAQSTCLQFYDRFFGDYDTPFLAVSLLVVLLPAFAGLFWAAPMITRELEAGTHLLAWSQSVTRRRWLAVKLGITCLLAMAAACLCGLMVTWWSGPLDDSAPADLALVAPLVFGARGVVPMGYAAFAVALGVAVGMFVRRTLPAMALTLAVFAAVQIAMPLLVRPHLMAPVTSTFEIGPANVEGISVDRDGGGTPRIRLKSVTPGHPGSWVLANGILDPAGRPLADDGGGSAVPVSTTSGPCAPGAAFGACTTEINRLGYRQRATFHPLERFWPLQWIETGIYAALALGLAGSSFWAIRRRLS
ncbi:transporter [Sphaerisporangium rufum]|uniref:Transporter n=1 Tax=Sphaerisporangium rufum TaxID=1381558 RepID=A0A919R443_9ACTN|nr:ABC transporter permease subunit [Sphaerisporangium rufum]GII78948.1 transporter [Sphaerisporangium rufum]